MHDIFPLLSFNDPREVWANHPTYLIGEVVIILLTLMLARCIIQNGRMLTFVITACFFGGALIELYTILEPQIGNFYHSQATIMTFGNREPVYMLCCYIFVQFTSLALAQQPKLSLWGEASVAALLATFLFGLLDAVGLKFIWWTWHNGDPLYVDRTMGVPIASAIWILSSTFCLAALVRVIVRASWFAKAPVVLLPLVAIIAGPFATLVLMNIPMTLSFHVLVTFLGFHASVALFALRALCGLYAVSEVALGPRRKLSFKPTDLFPLTVAFVVSLALVAYLGSPENIRRESFSQPFGHNCSELESSLWGAFQRNKYVCPEGVVAQRDHYSLDCGQPLPEDGVSWYLSCGVPIAADWWAPFAWYVGASLVLTVLTQFTPATTTATGVKVEGKKRK